MAETIVDLKKKNVQRPVKAIEVGQRKMVINEGVVSKRWKTTEQRDFFKVETQGFHNGLYGKNKEGRGNWVDDWVDKGAIEEYHHRWCITCCFYFCSFCLVLEKTS